MKSSTSTHTSIDIRVFQAMPGNSILLLSDTPTFTIVAATDNYYKTSGRTEEELVGKGIFEAFPSPPDDPDHKGVKQLLSSLEKVLHQKTSDRMPLVRYDIENADGSFQERYWSALNKPVLGGNGEILYIIHTAEEMTSLVKAEHSANRIKSLEKSHNLFMQAPVAIGIAKGSDYVIKLANDSLLEVWGRTAEEVMDKPLFDAVPDLAGQGFKELLDQVCASGEPFYGYEHPVWLTRNGKEELLYFDFVYKPYYEDGGAKPVGVFTVGHNVTEQVLVRRKLEESEERLSNIINQVNAGIAQTTVHGQFINANERYCQITGFTKEELQALTIKDLTHPDDWPRNEELVVKALREGKNFLIEKRYIRKDGSVIWVSNSVSIVTNTKGEKFITAVSVDITDQITSRQKLEESEERFRSMADASPVMIWTLDEAGNSTYYNARAAEFTGHTEEEIKEGKSWQVAIHPDDIEFAAGVVRNAVVNRIPYQMECRMQRADGEWRWLINHGTPRFGKSGEYFGFVGSSIDITEHKKSQQELQTALEQIRLSKEAAELGTFDMDLEKGTMHWDDRCRTLFGISHHDTVTYEHDFVKGLHPDDRERITKRIEGLFDKSINNGDYDVEYRTVGVEDGVVRWVRAKGKVYFNEQDKPIRFIGSVIDITDKVMAIQQIENLVEERTRELAEANERLLLVNKELQRSNQNLEEFAHAASHDLKEPVRKIHFFTNQLRQQLAERLSENEVRSFGRIENATQRMGNLIDDLLLYSHVSQRPHETETVDLAEKVQRVLEDLDLDIEEKGAILNIGKLPLVKGYRRQLQQLFQNLISNAIKYSKSDEVPIIDIAAEEVEKRGKCYHRISVKDNGIGFAQEYADKIFQMFTRLHGKAEYSGTGVGLSIVKKVVENHNGFIEVESEPGVGSTFKIFLPVYVN